MRRSETAARSTSVSPFAADSARKGTLKAESSPESSIASPSRPNQSSGANSNLVTMGSTALAIEEIEQEPAPELIAQPTTPEAMPEQSVLANTPRARPEVNSDSLRDAVLNALSTQPMLVSMLETAQWTLEGSSLIAKVPASTTMIEMSFTSDARRIASAAASGLAGRPIKVQVVPGGTSQAAANSDSSPRRSAPNGSARSRAEQDPLVQRMREKFGAEIRTVIDYREKGRS